MSDSSSTSVSDPLVYSTYITGDLGITDRCLRKWIALKKFAPPDTNISGRGAWLSSTYKREKTEILAGRFKQIRRPPSASNRAA